VKAGTIRDGKSGGVVLPRIPSYLGATAKAAALGQCVASRDFLLPFLTTVLMVTSASGTPQDDEPRLSMAMSQTDEGAAVVSMAELRSFQLPKHVRKLFGKAVKLDRKGNTSEALACLNLALDTAPEFIQAHVAAAIGYLKLGEPDQAQKHLTEALEVDHSYIPALEVQGILAFQFGRIEEARKVLEGLLKTAPGQDDTFLSVLDR